MTNSRTANSIRNSYMSMLSQIVSIGLNFIGRTFFIKLLNIDYLGINGLFTNILTLLSLAELGIGTAIIYMMYKPISDNDLRQVAAYNNLFKKVYNFIGCIIFILGLFLIPFLDVIINNPPMISENLVIIYILFLTNTSISYFFTYKRSLLIAYQKEYINSRNIIQFAIVKDVVLIIILYFTRDYYLYLGAQICITFLSNLAISYKTNKLFPDIVKLKHERVSKDDIRIIIKNTGAMLCHKIGGVIVTGTDSILISSFVGVAAVGIYSNYLLISTCTKQIIDKGINSLTASFGNLVASSSSDSVFIVFKRIFFINFTCAFFVSILFFALVDSFITIWIGDEFLMANTCVFIISFNMLFLNQLRIPSQIVINTFGLFWQIKWKSIVEALLNLLFSLIFVVIYNWGILGVLLGSLISNVLTNIWWEPYIAYKFGMKQSLSAYFISFIRYSVLFLFVIAIIKVIQLYIFLELFDNSVILFMANFLSSSILAIGLYWFFFNKKEEFLYMQNLLLQLIRK